MKTQIKNLIIQLKLKKAVLKLYFLIWNAVVISKTKFRHFSNPRKVSKQLQKGYLNIYLDSDWLGLGARLVKTFELLHYANLHNVEFNIDYGYNEKVKGLYFSKLFKSTKEHSFASKKYIRIEDTTEIDRVLNLNGLLNILDVNIEFNNFYTLSDAVHAELDNFINDNFINDKVLGVHYRGTDKIGEAPRFQEDNLILEIRSCLHFGFSKIFVSTDETSILDRIKCEFTEIPVIYRNDAFRSVDGDQFHRKMGNDKNLINHDALMNILILSKTDFLLKTASIMSDCCFVFNPNLSFKLLSTPHNSNLTWWPASELINSNQSL